MSEKPNSLLLRTPVFRMSYPNLVHPRAFSGRDGGKKGDPMYSLEMLYDKVDLEKFQVRREGEWEDIKLANAMAEVAKAEWPEYADQAVLIEAIKGRKLGWPLQNGDKKAADKEANKKKGEAYVGKWVVPAKTSEEFAPQLFVIDAGKHRELERSTDSDMAKAKSLFVAGYYARANLNVKSQETPQGRFVTFYVNAVLFFKQGERIGGMSGEDRWGGVDGGSSDADVTAGMDDEIPF